jgi:D-alanyl-D-alanine carboxypeptidase
VPAWRSQKDFLLAVARRLPCAYVAHEPYLPFVTGFDYSNTAYVLVGEVIEQLTAHSYRDKIQSRIIDRPGLKRT